MRSVALAYAVLLATSAGALAEPAMVADAGGGKIYTDARGMTLYTFDKDEAGKSNCYDKCAVAWPPLAAGADAKAEGEWTVVDRKDGTRMWAYDGKPLYTYVDDKKAGDITGDGKGGAWHVARPE